MIYIIYVFLLLGYILYLLIIISTIGNNVKTVLYHSSKRNVNEIPYIDPYGI